MSRYDIYLFIHILAATIWLGGGFMLVVQGTIAMRRDDESAMEYVLSQSSSLAMRMFIPASLVVFVMGMLMVLDGPWSFSQLWVTLGLIGYAATFVTGAGILGPMGKRIEAQIAEQGFTGEAVTAGRKLLVLARLDYTLFVLILIDMVLKPTGDDAGVLAVMAVLLVAGIAVTVMQARAVSPGMRAATARG